MDNIVAGVVTSSEHRPVINYILDGLSDEQYQSKRQQKKILRAATVKARVNAIHIEGSHEETKPMDSPISFHHVNSNRIIMPHYDALVLTLYISTFDVHKVLVDLGSIADLLQLASFNQIRLSLVVLNPAGRILSSFNGVATITLGDVTLHVRTSPITQQVLFSVVGDLGSYNAIMGWAWLHLMKVVPSTYH